jgi:hypothetical protein
MDNLAGVQPMDHMREEFRKHADDCIRMARSTVDSQSRAAWNDLAERWLGCEKLERAMAVAQTALEDYSRTRKRE